MGQLTKEDFEAKYTGNLGVGAVFKDNTTRAIVAAIMRQFADDIADTFLFNTSGEVSSWKEPCRVATTGNISLSGTQTIDTVACSNGDRVLVLNQTNATQNGIYVMASGAWSRSADADVAAELEGAAVAVQEGATYFSKIFVQRTTGITLGSSNIVWVVNGTSSGISGLNANFLPVASSGSTLTDSIVHQNGSNIGIGTTAAARKLHLLINDAVNNAVTYMLRLTHTTSGTPGNGLGVGIEFEGETANGVNEILALIEASKVSGTAGTLISQLDIRIQNDPAGFDIGATTFRIGPIPAAMIYNNVIDAVSYAMKLYHECAGTPQIGIGVGLQFEVETQAANPEIGALIEAIATNVGNGTENFDLSFKVMTAGAAATERMRIIGNNLALKAGSSAGVIAKVPGVIHTNITTTGNVTTGEDTLFTYTIPASVLATNKDTISAYVAGTFANNVNSKRVRVKYGATTIFDVTDVSSSPGSWRVDIEIIRTGPATQKIVTRGSSSTGSFTSTTFYNTAAETLSGTVALVVTGEATATNDIVFEMGKVRWEPAE